MIIFNIYSGFLVLKNLNVNVEAYFSSEINSDAINVTKMNYGSQITHLGDITKISDSQVIN